jgi:hypothetical protein
MTKSKKAAALTLKPLLTDHECSAITRRSIASLRRDRVSGTGIPFIKLGSRALYDPRDVAGYIANNRHTYDGQGVQ